MGYDFTFLQTSSSSNTLVLLKKMDNCAFKNITEKKYNGNFFLSVGFV